MFSIYTIIDGVFVARFAGPISLAAINIVYPFINILMGITIMFASGGSAIVAKTMGEAQPVLASERFTQTVCAAVLISTALGVFGLVFHDEVILALGATETLYEDCQAYLLPMLIFAPVMAANFIFDYFFVTAGKPGLSLGLSALSGSVNIGLDYVFLALWGWGISGAAWATVISYAVATFIGLIYIMSGVSRLWLKKFHLEKAVLLKTMTNGSSEMVTQLSLGITTYLFNLFTLQYAGEAGIAAITIILYSEMLLTAVYTGFTYGVAPIFSYNLGALRKDKIVHTMKLSLCFLAMASVLSFMAAQIFAADLVQIFVTGHGEVAVLATSGLALFSLSFLGCGFNLFVSGFFTALGNGRVSAFCSFLRNLAGIGLFLLLLPPFWGITGVWLAVPAADGCVLILSAWLLWNYYRDFSLSKCGENAHTS